MMQQLKIICLCFLLIGSGHVFGQPTKQQVTIESSLNHPRVQHGIAILQKALAASSVKTIRLSIDSSIRTKESYAIDIQSNRINIKASDASGILYACLSLKDSIQSIGKLPSTMHWVDSPQMLMRGTCIGIQKPYYLPGRTVYEYPYTPETFPWLYDKKCGYNFSIL